MSDKLLNELETEWHASIDRVARRGARLTVFIGFVMYVLGIACGATLMAVLGG